MARARFQDDSPSKKDNNAAAATAAAATCATNDAQSRPPPSALSAAISEALGRRLVNPVVSMVDVDGVIRRVDLNDAVDRINWNNVVDSIDWNNLLNKVDMDALLANVDIDAVMERIDMDAIVERSNLKAIMAKSTSGVMSHVMDSIRARIIMVDQVAQRVGRCEDCCIRCRGESPKLYQRKFVLPPKPNHMNPFGHRKKRKEDLAFRKSIPCPDTPSHLAIAVQGRAAGIFSRFAAFIIDWFLMLASYTMLFLVINETVQDIRLARGESEAGWQLSGELGFVVWLAYNFLYYFTSLATTQKSIGKYCIGLTVVQSNSNARRMNLVQVFVRSVLMATPFFLVFAALFQWVREDRRSLIDLLAGTAVIYTWDAKKFQMVEDAVESDDETEESDVEELLQELETQRLERRERRLERQKSRKFIRQETMRRRTLGSLGHSIASSNAFHDCDEQNSGDVGLPPL